MHFRNTKIGWILRLFEYPHASSTFYVTLDQLWNGARPNIIIYNLQVTIWQIFNNSKTTIQNFLKTTRMIIMLKNIFTTILVTKYSLWIDVVISFPELNDNVNYDRSGSQNDLLDVTF